MRLKKKHEEHEEEIDESWLVPYADILTLLLALFIVLFASSKIDQEKFKGIADSFKAVFGSGSGIMENNANVSGIDISAPKTTRGAGGDYQAENQMLEMLKSRYERFVAANKLDRNIDIRLKDEGLVFEFNEEIFFTSGNADLLQSAYPELRKLSDIFNELPNNILVSGHTDDRSISTAEFPTNWDLSSKRALNVMKFLLKANTSLRPERFSSVGYAQYRPSVPNITDENRAKNRRVEVLVERKYPLAK